MNNNNSVLKKVLNAVSRYHLLLILSIILAALSVIGTLYAPILFGDAIDMIVENGIINFSGLLAILMQIGVIVVLTGIFTFLMNIINNHVTYHVVQDIRNRAIEKIQRLPLSYLDVHSTGDIVSRIITDTDQLSDGLLLGFTQLFTGIFTIFITLFFMFRKSVLITILVLALTPVSFLVARFIATRSYNMFRKQAEVRGKQTTLIDEMIGNQKVVKAFGYEQRASKRFEALNKDLQKYSQSAIFYSSLTNPSTRAVNNVIYALVALIGMHLIMNQQLTVGGLSVLLAYANQYMKPFNDISSVITELQNALACAARVFEILESDEEVIEKQEIMPQAAGNVSIDHVAFSYTEKPFIEDFNLHTKPGTHVAIVGLTGCGKTTFINLLMRFYDTTDGTISIEDRNIQDVTRHSLREQFGMVLQETWLKNGTIRENIAFGKPDATDEEIIAAAKESHAWSFIRRLPNQLDEVISEDTLSQGQKQLLCITRVMLAIPPMLILDEATSAIDTRTEIQIQNAFDKLMEGRTSFVVAHRLSTIRNADLILVMKDGKIIEQGNHDSLMKQNGFYTNLYQSQFVQSNS